MGNKETRTSRTKIKPEKSRKELSRAKKALVFLFAMIAFAMCNSAYYASYYVQYKIYEAAYETYEWTDAVTTPWGIIYFRDKNSTLIAHENCHLKRLQEIGALAFYSNYLLGGGAEEEARCGEGASHNINNLFWMRQPSHVTSRQEIKEKYLN
jgi:hypothetical protein